VGGGGDPFLGARVPAESHTDGDSTTTVLHTPTGDLRTVHRRTSVTSATVEFYCRNADDLAKVMSLPYEEPPISLSDYFAWEERAGDEALTLVGVADAICWPAALLSPEDFCFCWADSPEQMVALTNLGHQRLMRYVERLCEAGAKGFRIVGGEYATTQLGPAGFDALCAEQDRELCALMRRYGAVSYYHNHGLVMPFLEQFRAVGMDAIDPFEAPPYGDCDLREAKQRLGNVCIVGNLDDMELMEQLPPAELQTIAAERLEQAGRTGFVLGGTASGTYTEVGARGFMALVEVAESYRG